MPTHTFWLKKLYVYISSTDKNMPKRPSSVMW